MFFRYIVDDALITFRYSRNLAETGIITYNIGEAPVEGYSTFLFMLLLVPAFWMGFDVVIVSNIITGISAHIALILLTSASANYFPKAHFPYIASLVLAITPSYAIHSVSGMETSVYLLIISMLLYSYSMDFTPKTRIAVNSFLLLFLCLARIEAVLVAGAILLFDLFALLGRKRIRDIGVILIPGFLIAAYNLWRYFYFGSFLSSPTIYKRSPFEGLISPLGLERSLEFLMFYSPYILMAIISLLEVEKPEERILRLLVLFAALWGVTLLFHPTMGFEFRFTFPSLLPLMLIAVPFLSKLLGYAVTIRTSEAKLLLEKLWRFRLLLPIIVLLAIPVVRLPRSYSLAMNYTDGMESAHIPLGIWLGENAPTEAIAAVDDIGAIGFYSKLFIVDTLALVIPELLEGGYNASIVFDYDPDYFVIASMDGDDFIPVFTKGEAIAAHPEFSNYTKIDAYEFSNEYYLWLFGRQT